MVAERLRDMIYMSFDGVAACFRRHNGTHQFGCSCKASFFSVFINFNAMVFTLLQRISNKLYFFVTASRSGDVGIIHLIEEDNDIKWLEHNTTTGPYTVVLPFSMFTRNILLRLKNTKNINGVLLAKNISQSRPDAYSPEDTCPNRYAGYKRCDDDTPWNPYGSSLLMEDWPFPMFYTEVIIKS